MEPSQLTALGKAKKVQGREQAPVRVIDPSACWACGERTERRGRRAVCPRGHDTDAYENRARLMLADYGRELRKPPVIPSSQEVCVKTEGSIPVSI
jgi:hypothetical protein